MSKLAKSTISYGRTDGWTDPYYRKALPLKTKLVFDLVIP